MTILPAKLPESNGEAENKEPAVLSIGKKLADEAIAEDAKAPKKQTKSKTTKSKKGSAKGKEVDVKLNEDSSNISPLDKKRLEKEEKQKIAEKKKLEAQKKKDAEKKAKEDLKKQKQRIENMRLSDEEKKKAQVTKKATFKTNFKPEDLSAAIINKFDLCKGFMKGKNTKGTKKKLMEAMNLLDHLLQIEQSEKFVQLEFLSDLMVVDENETKKAQEQMLKEKKKRELAALKENNGVTSKTL